MDDRERTVLVVDDGPRVREVRAEYLTERSFEVIGAAQETPAFCDRARPATARLGGIEALKRIRAFDPAVIVVIVTGAPDVDLHRQAIALGAQAVLPKPIVSDDLLAALGGSRVTANEAPDTRARRS
jgi:CheY-like chemotaxis protein